MFAFSHLTTCHESVFCIIYIFLFLWQLKYLAIFCLSYDKPHRLLTESLAVQCTRWIFICHKNVKRNCDFSLIFSFWWLYVRNNPRSSGGGKKKKRLNHIHLLYVSRAAYSSNAAIPKKVIGLYFIYLSKSIFTCICHLPRVNSGPWVHTSKISFQWLHAPPVIWQTHSE